MTAWVVGVAGPAGAVTEKEIERARAERVELQERLDEVVGLYGAVHGQLASTQEGIARSGLRIEELSQELASVQAKLSMRASLTYKQGRAGFVAVLLEAESPAEFLRRIVLLERAAGSDSTIMLRARRLKASLEEERQSLLAKRSQEQEAARRLRELSAQISSQFEAARALEAKLVLEKQVQDRLRREAAARAARAAAIARRSSRSFNPGAFVCPMDGPNSFTDTWGDARSGGRRHQGVDIFAAYGTPIAAVVDGTITRLARSSLGGITLYLRGGDGTEYFYAHLSGYAGVSEGQRVSAGSHVAFNGNSGNARGTAPHLHFEIHPGGGAAINPYPTVRAACR